MSTNAEQKELQDVGPELKAYIHQQLAALEPYVLSDSNLQFLIEKVISEANNTAEYRVTLLLTSGGAQLTSQQSADNIYDAVALAKEGVLQSIYSALEASTSQGEHAQAVEEAKHQVH